MSKPRLSIVMPVWNGMPFVREAVHSVLHQDFQEWELLIGDNCSNDETVSFLRSLNDVRIKKLFNAENLGIWGNLNSLIGIASSEYCHILCADDYYLPGGLGKIHDTWQKQDDDVAAIRFNADAMRCSSLFWRNAYDVIPKAICPADSDIFYFAFGCFPGVLSNVSFKTSAARAAGLFRTDLPFAGDFEFWSRLGRSNKWVIEDCSVCFERRHSNNASIYLNRKGEVISQANTILEPIFLELKRKVPETLLRLHASLSYDVVQMHAGLSLAWRTGNLDYLREANRSSKISSMFLPSIFRWPLYLMTFGGRVGRASVANALVRCYSNKYINTTHAKRPGSFFA